MELTSEIATINTEQVAVIIGGAPEALQLNKTSVENATKAAQAVIDTVEAEGMSEELDQRCNITLVKINKTIELMNDRRKPITQIMDLIKKEFTQLENAIDKKNANGVYARIQKLRDDYATKKANDKREADQVTARKLAVDKERISLTSDCELKLKQHFLDFLQAQKVILNNTFEALTIENLENETGRIRNYPETYPHKHYEQFNPFFGQAYYLTPDEVAKIIIDVTKGKFGDFNTQFNSEIVAYKHELLDKIPSKKSELEVIAEAAAETKRLADIAAKAKSKKAKEEAEAAAASAAAESTRLADEAAKRAADEEERMRAEAAKKTQDAVSSAESNKQASMTEALFDAQNTMSTEGSSAQVRESYEIEILKPAGWLNIVQLYFEHEGMTEDVVKLEKKTLGSMKKFCESLAMKSDIKISSPFIKYTEKFKTVAKKA